jgi:hypothetical protein
METAASPPTLNLPSISPPQHPGTRYRAMFRKRWVEIMLTVISVLFTAWPGRPAPATIRLYGIEVPVVETWNRCQLTIHIGDATISYPTGGAWLAVPSRRDAGPYALGREHHVRFVAAVRDHLGRELRAVANLDIDRRGELQVPLYLESGDVHTSEIALVLQLLVE